MDCQWLCIWVLEENQSLTIYSLYLTPTFHMQQQQKIPKASDSWRRMEGKCQKSLFHHNNHIGRMNTTNQIVVFFWGKAKASQEKLIQPSNNKVKTNIIRDLLAVCCFQMEPFPQGSRPSHYDKSPLSSNKMATLKLYSQKYIIIRIYLLKFTIIVVLLEKKKKGRLYYLI
jgi:hypothetical protein